MTGTRRAILAVAVAAILVWAAVEARNLNPGGVTPGYVALPPAEPTAVEGSFADVVAAQDAGRCEEALLALRERTVKGPYPGYAWFLLGEIAYEDRAYAAAVRHYRRAVEVDPSVTARASAFASARTMGSRLRALREGPWAEDRPPEIRDLYYLQRRLAGGCE